VVVAAIALRASRISGAPRWPASGAKKSRGGKEVQVTGTRREGERIVYFPGPFATQDETEGRGILR
jgi:hypothetical protein